MNFVRHSGSKDFNVNEFRRMAVDHSKIKTPHNLMVNGKPAEEIDNYIFIGQAISQGKVNEYNYDPIVIQACKEAYGLYSSGTKTKDELKQMLRVSQGIGEI